jgi:hypothetical protein
MAAQKRFGSARGRGREISTRLAQSSVRFDSIT